MNRRSFIAHQELHHQDNGINKRHETSQQVIQLTASICKVLAETYVITIFMASQLKRMRVY